MENTDIQMEHIDNFQEILFNIEKNKPELEKDRIEILNKLHGISIKSSHVVAKLLLQQDEILKERYRNWKLNGTIEEYNQPKSIYQWVNIHKEKLNFGEKQARRYIQLFEDTENTPVIGEKLGTKKNEIIRRVPEKYRSELRQKAVEDNWSTSKVEKEVNKIKDKEIKINNLKKIKPHLPFINIQLDKKNKNKIIIETNPDYRDTLNNILQEKYIQKIKQEMYTFKNIVA